MLSPLRGGYSFHHWVAKPRPDNPQGIGFWRRVLQVCLCLVYFIDGLARFFGNRSWDGSAFWRSLIRPPFDLASPNLGNIFAMHPAIGRLMRSSQYWTGEHRRLQQLPRAKHSHQSYRIRTPMKPRPSSLDRCGRIGARSAT